MSALWTSKSLICRAVPLNPNAMAKLSPLKDGRSGQTNRVGRMESGIGIVAGNKKDRSMAVVVLSSLGGCGVSVAGLLIGRKIFGEVFFQRLSDARGDALLKVV